MSGGRTKRGAEMADDDVPLRVSKNAKLTYRRYVELSVQFEKELIERYPDGKGGILITPELRKAGIRPDIHKTWAIEQIAREQNRDFRQVRGAVYAYNRAQAERERKRRHAGKSGLELELFDMQVPSEWVVHVQKLRESIEASFYDLSQVRDVAKELRESKHYPERIAVEIERVVLSLANLMKDSMPWGLCPYCKGLDQVQPQCSPCSQTGLVTERQAKSAPVRYTSKMLPMVQFQGEDRKVSEFE